MQEVDNIKVGDTVLLAVIDRSSFKVIKFVKRAGFIVQILTVGSQNSALMKCCYKKEKEWQYTNTSVPTIYNAPVSRMVLTEKTNKIFDCNNNL